MVKQVTDNPPELDIADARQFFRLFLKEKSQKYSQARSIISERVFKTTGHFSAEDLVTQLKSGSDRVSRGTIYRTLQLLEMAGVIRLIHEGASHRYESVIGREPHDHAVCRGCGKIIELSDGLLRERTRLVCDEIGFEVNDISVQIQGFCLACRRHGI